MEANSGATGGAKSATNETVKQAKSMLSDTATQLRQTANSVVDQAATDTGIQLSETAVAVRDSLGPLRQRQPQLAALADRSVDKLEQAAAGLMQQDLESIADGAGRLARQHPAAFFGGAALAGLLLGRFLQQMVDSR